MRDGEISYSVQSKPVRVTVSANSVGFHLYILSFYTSLPSRWCLANARPAEPAFLHGIKTSTADHLSRQSLGTRLSGFPAGKNYNRCGASSF